MSYRRISGWWRIGIVLCTLAGLFGLFIGFDAHGYFTEQFDSYDKAERWLPNNCREIIGDRNIEMRMQGSYETMPAIKQAGPWMDEKSGKAYEFNVSLSCVENYHELRAVLTGAAFSVFVAGVLFVLAWIVSGFRRQDAH